MPKGGICIQYIDFKFCILHDKVSRYWPVKFCNRKYKDYVYRKMLVQEYLKK